jgi:glycosyltransferase involved in cell wall biosynthesis
LKDILLSVVIPFYNESRQIDALFARLLPLLDSLHLNWELICINDGSRDNTLARLIEFHQRHTRVKIIDLSRNFGKEIALSAGLMHTKGDAVVPMDADLQHPPEIIKDMLSKWEEGFDMVYAVRKARVGQTLANRVFAKMFYWVFDRLSDLPLPHEAGDFRLLDRKVVDIINQMPERSRFMKGIFAWVGFRQIGIPYTQEIRASSHSRWSFVKLFRFATDGVTAFSNFPLRVWAAIGVAISATAFLYILVRIIRVLIFGIDVPGYESLLAAVLFLGGVQLISLGIIGDYLGRVFNEVKRRPLFIVRSTYGI